MTTVYKYEVSTHSGRIWNTSYEIDKETTRQLSAQGFRFRKSEEEKVIIVGYTEQLHIYTTNPLNREFIRNKLIHYYLEFLNKQKAAIEGKIQDMQRELVKLVED